MAIRIQNIIKLTAAVSLLNALCACTAPQSAPNMVDYSYVPPTTSITVVTVSNVMEDF